MKCIYCDFELPANAKFCPKCLHQIICRECGEILFKDSPICISCGMTVNDKHSENKAINTIEITENEKEKSFKAAFTDTVGGNVVEVFSQFLPFTRFSGNKAISAVNNEINPRIIEDVEVIENSVSKPSANPVHQKEIPNDLVELEKIFKNKNGVISIYDPRIKAKNKSDFIGRITLLFLYYKELLGTSEVQRSELNDLLDKDNLKDATIRTFLSSNKKLLENNQTYIELRPEGRERAQEILSDFENPDIPNIWDLKSSSKKNSTNKDESKDNSSTVNGKSKASKRTISYQIDSNLNLKPSGKESLIDFCARYKAKNNFEYNLLFVYYIQKVLNQSNISINQIYTCYKELGLKVPNIKQSLWDTKNREGWIETKDTNDLKIPIAGENHLEHKMTIKK